MSKRPNDRKSEMPQDRTPGRTASMSEAALYSGADTTAEQPRDLGNPDAALTPPEPSTKPQPDRGVAIPAALASLWRAMVALPTGHPALRSLQKCEDAGSAEAVPMLKMCAAALRLMHLNASAEHVERSMELLSELRSAAA